MNTHEAILRPALKLGLQPDDARRLSFQLPRLMAIDDVQQVFFGILHSASAKTAPPTQEVRPIPVVSPMNRLDRPDSEVGK